MDDVMANGRALGWPQGVDATHVAEEAPSEMVNVIEFDSVSLCQAFGVSPAPPHGDTGVIKVSNFVMRHLVVTTMADPNSHGAREDTTTMADNIVLCYDFSSEFSFRRSNADLTYANATCPQIVQMASLDP